MERCGAINRFGTGTAASMQQEAGQLQEEAERLQQQAEAASRLAAQEAESRAEAEAAQQQARQSEAEAQAKRAEAAAQAKRQTEAEAQAQRLAEAEAQVNQLTEALARREAVDRTREQQPAAAAEDSSELVAENAALRTQLTALHEVIARQREDQAETERRVSIVGHFATPSMPAANASDAAPQVAASSPMGAPAALGAPHRRRFRPRLVPGAVLSSVSLVLAGGGSVMAVWRRLWWWWRRWRCWGW